MEDAESQSTGSLVTIIPESWYHPSKLWALSATFPTVRDINETGNPGVCGLISMDVP